LKYRRRIGSAYLALLRGVIQSFFDIWFRQVLQLSETSMREDAIGRNTAMRVSRLKISAAAYT